MTVVGKPRDADPRDVADAERTALRVEFDRRGTDGDDVTRFPHPRQLHDVRAAALAEQDLRELSRCSSLPRSSTYRTIVHGDPGSSSS